ncbi:hypothetical protein OHA37_07265 [Streptomyces sp. NBC_00335]|uniref:hypothetical protein n=1 Tax=unclassified Streptomyces TaxID=2593676 RepID=UPI002259BB2D|nr:MULTISPECIES: hypothetical protein [unclassified Streptomyces]MCX5403682.1 hypothetical protein [Streptomyces sp. NBC_00086]
MADAVPVRCPACLRENGYAVPVFPCACGNPVTPPLDLTSPPRELTHRTWTQSWVAVRCEACGRESEWPHPEVGCTSCGTVVLVPVHPLAPVGGVPRTAAAAQPPGSQPPGSPLTGSAPRAAESPGWPVSPAGPAAAGPGPGPARDPSDTPGSRTPADPAVPRPDFRPVTIRTARDAVVTAALYLRWLGFQDVRQPDGRPIPSTAVDLRAPGLVAQVDPTTAPAGLRAVECVWLNGLTACATSVYFSLAGYTEDARARADDLGIPLFVMDLTGMPQPVNDPAEDLLGMGA